MKISDPAKVAELLKSMGYELDIDWLTRREAELSKEIEHRTTAESELRTCRGFLKTAQDNLRKAQERTLLLERDLSRALGYIDRVVELEAPPPEPVFQEQRCLAPRGPRMSEGHSRLPDSLFRS